MSFYNAKCVGMSAHCTLKLGFKQPLPFTRSHLCCRLRLWTQKARFGALLWSYSFACS